MPRLGLLLGLCCAATAAGRAAESAAVAIQQVDASRADGMLLAGDRVDFRECLGEYRILPYVRVAAKLLALPEAERIAQLRAWANYRGNDSPFHNMALNEHLLYLYRLLFEKKGVGNGDWIFGPFWIGGPDFVGMARRPLTEEDCAAYPDSPFLFVGDVPFFVVRGYARDFAPDAGKYLEFFLKDAQWSRRRYDQVTPAVIAQALRTLLEKHAWPRALTPEEKRFLTEQTSPDAATLWPEVQGISAHAVFNTMYRKEGFDLGGVRSLDKLDRLAVIVSGGVLPYRYEIRLETDGRVAVVGSGEGGIDLLDQLGWGDARVTLPMPWAAMKAGQVITLEVTDAKGAQLVQRLRVAGPKSVAIDYPVVTQPKAE